jgi:hypothetical protein
MIVSFLLKAYSDSHCQELFGELDHSFTPPNPAPTQAFLRFCVVC